MIVRPAERADASGWQRMRATLWPDCDATTHAAEIENYFVDQSRARAFVAVAPDDRLVGFLEASLRFDYVEGCHSSPVGYIEGWYVEPSYRRAGTGAMLVVAAENWAIQRGCTEMGSDCLLDNEISYRAHVALGYEEVSRVIHFKKALVDDSPS